MFDTAIIKRICHELAAENDSQRARELLSLLESVVRDDQEEVRLRLKYLAKHYKSLLEDEEALNRAASRLSGTVQIS